MANLKAVLFDLDDTLVPEMEPEREALLVVCGLAAEKYGTDPEAMSESVAEAAEKLWAQWRSPALYSSIAYSGWEGLWGPPDLPDDGLGNDQETIDKYKRDAWDEVLSIHGIVDTTLRDEMIVRHRLERVSRLIPYDGAEKVLERVKVDYPLAIITNGSPAVQRFKLERSGLAGHFSVFVASGDVGVGKPDPKPFLTALKSLDVSPAESVMIGNSWNSDIRGAVNLGIPSIWYNPDREQQPSHGTPPTLEIASLSEVPGAIRRIASL
jgi:putative hydrolase of the HAD superfamily